MSKAIAATCEDGVVTAQGVAISGCEIFSEGVGSSAGLLIVDEDKSYYVARISPDLKTTLEKVVDALDKAASALSAIDGAGYIIAVVGTSTGVPSPPVATADISGINTAKSALNTLLGELR